MPQKNQKSVTLPKKVVERAEKAAQKLGKSTAGFVTELINQNTVEVPSE